MCLFRLISREVSDQGNVAQLLRGIQVRFQEKGLCFILFLEIENRHENIFFHASSNKNQCKYIMLQNSQNKLLTIKFAFTNMFCQLRLKRCSDSSFNCKISCFTKWLLFF